MSDFDSQFESKFLEDTNEDLELLSNPDLSNPVRFFHQGIRAKYFKRMQKHWNTPVDSTSHDPNKFQVILALDDYYKLYASNYKQQRLFHSQIDAKLFGHFRRLMNSKEYAQYQAELQPNKDKASFVFEDPEIRNMLNVFKIQIDLL